MVKRVCIICGKTFEGKTKRSRICSPECKSKSQWLLFQAKRDNLDLSTITSLEDYYSKQNGSKLSVNNTTSSTPKTVHNTRHTSLFNTASVLQTEAKKTIKDSKVETSHVIPQKSDYKKATEIEKPLTVLIPNVPVSTEQITWNEDEDTKKLYKVVFNMSVSICGFNPQQIYEITIKTDAATRHHTFKITAYDEEQEKKLRINLSSVRSINRYFSIVSE